MAKSYYESVHPLVRLPLLIMVCYLLPACAFYPDYLPSSEVVGVRIGNWLAHASTEYKWTLRSTFFLTFVLNSFLATFTAMIVTYLDLDWPSSIKWVSDVMFLGVLPFSKLFNHLLATHQAQELEEFGLAAEKANFEQSNYQDYKSKGEVEDYSYARRVAKLSQN